ncbi:titin-like [Pangasianodon hypophthalmus]|uniref:titin-like n=1 Tax=Pangasianodon hypophthalmus TaxID=310915 RepID=UPI0023079965|nr:titin-like [Pangasianodon hypophthalmus]
MGALCKPWHLFFLILLINDRAQYIVFLTHEFSVSNVSRFQLYTDSFPCLHHVLCFCSVSVLISFVPLPHAQGSPKAVVSIKPDENVYIGERVTLRCDVQEGGDTEWTYSWYKNNDRLYVERGDRVYTDSTMQEVSIRSVSDSDSGDYTCQGQRRDSQSSDISDTVTLTVSERPRAVLSVSPQSWLTEGDSVTLSCEVTDSSTDWTFSWYTVVLYRDNNGHISAKKKLLSDSSRGSRGFYTLSPAALNHTGVYVCRGEREERRSYTNYSNLQLLWITGEEK